LRKLLDISDIFCIFSVTKPYNMKITKIKTKAGEFGAPVSTELSERIEMAFQTCLSKALDDCPENMEACLQTLADYCDKTCLEEEGCV